MESITVALFVRAEERKKLLVLVAEPCQVYKFKVDMIVKFQLFIQISCMIIRFTNLTRSLLLKVVIKVVVTDIRDILVQITGLAVDQFTEITNVYFRKSVQSK